MCKWFTAGVCALALLCLPAAGWSKQLPGTNDPDYQEVLAYRLTVPGMQKMLQAMRNIAAAAKTDPRFIKQQSLEAQIEALEAKEEPTDADLAKLESLREEVDRLDKGLFDQENLKTLSDMAAAMKKEPLLAKALADANVEPREFMKFFLAYMQAGMLHGMMKSGMIKEVPREFSGQVSMDNLTFVKEHEAELEAFTKEMETLNGKKKE